MLNNLLKKCAQQTLSAKKENFRLLRLYATANNAATTPQAVPATDLSKVVELPNFTTAECEKILDCINNNSVEQLLGYEISKVRANKLHAWKSRNGPLRTLEDILYVEGFGLKVATKFYKSLLEESKKTTSATGTNTKSARTAPFITPALDEAQRQQIRSCVSVRVGVSSVTWARLELAVDEHSPCTLSHWQHHEIVDKKLHLSDLIQRCLYVTHQIPTADCYLLENPQMAQASNNPGSVDQQNVNIQKAQVTAVISFALGARDSVTDMEVDYVADSKVQRSNPKTRLFYLRRFLAARLFNQLVGTERVSSENTVLSLMRTHYNLEEHEDFIIQAENVEATISSPNDKYLSIRGNIQFPQELREMFSQAGRYQREFLGQALLLNLAFVRLVLLQDAASIAAVAPGRKKLNIEDVI